jgi:hypothetical protein
VANIKILTYPLKGSNNLPIVDVHKEDIEFEVLHGGSWWSILMERDMARLRDKYSIPESMVLRPFGANKGVIVDHKCHEVCLYEEMFKAGF